jgi:hypothetical protein
VGALLLDGKSRHEEAALASSLQALVQIGAQRANVGHDGIDIML